MPIYTARVTRTITDEHAATPSVEADTLAKAEAYFREVDLENFQFAADYHSADDDETDYKHCLIDGVAVGDDWQALGPIETPPAPLTDTEWEESTRLVKLFIAGVADFRTRLEIIKIATGRLWWHFANDEAKAVMRTAMNEAGFEPSIYDPPPGG
jgi:hypothetical protein